MGSPFPGRSHLSLVLMSSRVALNTSQFKPRAPCRPGAPHCLGQSLSTTHTLTHTLSHVQGQTSSV